MLLNAKQNFIFPMKVNQMNNPYLYKKIFINLLLNTFIHSSPLEYVIFSPFSTLLSMWEISGVVDLEITSQLSVITPDTSRAS